MTGEYKDFEHRNRLYIDAVVFSKDIDKNIHKAFSSESTIQFIDSKGKEFEVLIAHLSRIGNKSHLNLIGQKELEQGIVPEGSVFTVRRTSGKNLLRDVVKKGMADIDANGWDEIYGNKIKAAEKRWNERIYDPKKGQ